MSPSWRSAGLSATLKACLSWKPSGNFAMKSGRENAIFIHLTWVPFIKTAGEVKTKPTQHSVAALRQIGIQPDILLCRTENFLSNNIKAKIALFCNVEVEAVFTAKDVNCIYEVPLNFHQGRA